MTRTAVVACLVLAAWPAAARAQQNVDARRSASPDGVVAIENWAGSVRVVGWAKAEVAVTGQLGAGADGVELSGSGARTQVEVEIDGVPHGVESHLEVRVPQGSRVEVEGFACSVTVTGVTGAVVAETVNGSISVGPGAREVEAQAVNGAVEVGGGGERVLAKSVNGAVTVSGARGDVTAGTVNGAVTLIGTALSRAQVETVNGGISVEVSLAPGGTLGIETVSGPVSVTLPAATAANFSLSTFSGSIENAFVPGASSSHRHSHRKEVEFSTGGGGATVTISTLSGRIVLRKN